MRTAMLVALFELLRRLGVSLLVLVLILLVAWLLVGVVTRARRRGAP